MEPPLKKRILLLLAVITVQSIYIPTSLMMRGGIEPKLSWDIFPLQAGWVVPYTLCYPLWALAVVWLAWKMDGQRFRATIAGLFFTCSLGVSIFLLFPTYVVHPELTGTDFFSELLLILQVAGGNYDALPSAHIYITTILALFYSDWYPKGKWFWLLILLVISLSTLFTRQHYIADVLAGYLPRKFPKNVEVYPWCQICCTINQTDSIQVPQSSKIGW